MLAPRGRLIISVPNAVNITVRLPFLLGRFEYADRGILDWSHLRFFTRSSIRRLLEKHGYRITGRHYTIMPLERVIPLPPENKFLRLMNNCLRIVTDIAPGLFAYEIFLIAES
jgi:hypothetical protein